MPVDDIQTLAFGGLSRLSASCLVLLRFPPDKSPREALSLLLPHITFGMAEHETLEAVQLGITPRGLTALGVAPHSLPFAFRDPLASEHHQRVLGDAKESAPQQWLWNGDDADIVLLLYASSPQRIAELVSHVAAGYERVQVIHMQLLDDNREHFGFRDGMGNPTISWDDSPADLPPGEFVLGYPDSAGELPQSIVDNGVDLGLDGSFLVIRQLSQDVEGFWQALRNAGDDPVRLAAKMVGRWPDGRLLTPTESFAEDSLGLSCPRGAHVRRAHPRDALMTSNTERNRHRLLRRGRPYGPPADPAVYPPGIAVTAGDILPDTNANRGLVFMCLCADLARQFEHVQQSWLNNTKHDDLHDEICPISSAAAAVGDSRRFTIPQYPVRKRIQRWPTVVQVKGTAYAILMGRGALAHLCTAEMPGTSETY